MELKLYTKQIYLLEMIDRKLQDERPNENLEQVSEWEARCYPYTS